MTNRTIDLYWSVRSPYCYLALDRLLALQGDGVTIHLKPVYPIAIRDPNFFKVRASKHYRSYSMLDTPRIAECHGIPFRRPVPDPIVQNLETGEIAIDQPHVRLITRLTMLAAEQGRGMAFIDQTARLLWDGGTDNWDQGSHMTDAARRAGLDYNELLAEAETDPDSIDARIQKNEAAQEAAGHSGVPLMVYDGEPFFGQDRIDLLRWRMGL